MARHLMPIPRVRPILQWLVPLEGTSWLTLRSWARPGRYVLLGLVSVFLVLCLVGERLKAQASLTVGAWLVVLIVATIIGVFGTLCLLVMHALHRHMYQWCPDCLQSMARGAHVCPYCGLRPDEVQLTHVPSQLEPVPRTPR